MDVFVANFETFELVFILGVLILCKVMFLLSWFVLVDLFFFLSFLGICNLLTMLLFWLFNVYVFWTVLDTYFNIES